MKCDVCIYVCMYVFMYVRPMKNRQVQVKFVKSRQVQVKSVKTLLLSRLND